MNITIKIKEVYGLPVAYPVDDNARLFAELAGTKTLTLKTLRTIKKLGYEVEVQQEALAL